MARYALTARQEMFARHFGQLGEIAPAYLAAFPEENASKAAAYKKGWDMLQNQGVKARARAVRDEMVLDVVSATRALAAFYTDVLTAPRDVVQHRRGACRYCYGAGGRYQWRTHEYLERLDEAEHHNRVKPRGTVEMALPDPLGGFGYDDNEPPNEACEACKGRGVGVTFVRDTSSLSPEQEAAFEGLELTATGLKAKYVAKSEAAQGLMKLYGLGAENVRLLVANTEASEAPEIPDDPMKAAEVYREFMAGRLTGPSEGT